MPTVNEMLANAAVDHAVDLQRYSNGVSRRMIGILNRADASLFAQLIAALERMDAGSFTVERLKSLLVSVRDLNHQVYRTLDSEMSEELRKFVELEAAYQNRGFKAAIPAQVSFTTITPETVYAAAMARPFQGVLLREFAENAGAARMRRIEMALRMGYVEGKTTPAIVREIRGTKAAGYADGMIEIDRRSAEALVRTSISHFSNFTRDRFIEENDGLLKAVKWVSTLDARTTPLCRIRDGKLYTVKGHKPIDHSVPWLSGPGRLHWNCRSTSAPVVKSWQELGIDMEEAPPGSRASMDGQVPADETYGSWLKKQAAARQDDILGKTRGALLRQGGLEMDQFYNDKGKFLTLNELREKQERAFSKAGV